MSRHIKAKKKNGNISNAILKTKQLIKALKKKEEVVMSFRKDIRKRSKMLVDTQAVIEKSGELGGQIAQKFGFDAFIGEGIYGNSLDPRENRGLSPVLKDGEVDGFVQLDNLREGADRHLAYLSTPSVLTQMTGEERRDAATLAKNMGVINRRWGGIHERTYKPKKNLKMPTVEDYIEVSLAAAQRRRPENRAFVDGDINIVPLREQNSPELQARRVVVGRINELKIALVNSKSRAERDKIMEEIESINRDTPTRENAVFAERLKQLRKNPGKKKSEGATEVSSVSPEVSPVSDGMESFLLSNELGVSPPHTTDASYAEFLYNTSGFYIPPPDPSGREGSTAMETKSMLHPVFSPDTQNVENLVQQANALNDEIAAYIAIPTPEVSPINDQDNLEEEYRLLLEEKEEDDDEVLNRNNKEKMARDLKSLKQKMKERKEKKKGGGRRTKKKGARKRRKTRVKRKKRKKTRGKRKKRKKRRRTRR